MTLDMFTDNQPDTEGETSSDSYCTPPEVCECIKASVNGCSVEELGRAAYPHHVERRVALDPWTNRRAISHGWLAARLAWTLEDGRPEDIDTDPRPWPLVAGDYAHGNPPYSAPHKYVERFLHELEQAKAWGGLLMKTDNRTQWWRDIANESPFVVIWDGPVNFFHLGERVKGNNFASSILVVDHTGMPRTKRYDQLRRAYAGKAWVYR